jgi:very-short-patch-repair endonuclease
MVRNRKPRLKKINLARTQRQAPIPAEKLLWQALRNREFAGFKFRRQHPIGPYVVDFACIEAKLVVEIDGETHLASKQEDEKRTKLLESEGWRVLRFWNSEVYDDFEPLKEMIYRTCVERTSESAPPSPPAPLPPPTLWLQTTRRFRRGERGDRLAMMFAACFLLVGSAVGAQGPSYSKDIRPIVAKYCLECHNAKSMRGTLSLETHRAMIDGSDNGPVIVVGQPDKSKLVLLCEGKEKPMMPPAKAKFHPSKAEIAQLRAWVLVGAKDDSAEVKVVLPAIKPKADLLSPVKAVAYLTKTKELLVARQNGLAVVDLGKRSVETWKPTSGKAITAMAAAQSGSYAVGTEDGKSETPVLVEGVRSPLLGQHSDSILDMAFTGDGWLIATAGYDSKVVVADGVHWPSGPPPSVLELKEHSDAVYGVTFNPNGKLLASVSADRAMKVFDVEKGKLLYTLGDATDWLYAVAWSPDGKYLVSGGVDKSIRVYEPTPTGAKLRQSVFAHQGAVLKLVFAGDSKTLYSVGEDRVVKAWDIEKMIEKKVYDKQPETVLCLALREDAGQIIIGRYDGIVQLIDMKTGKVAHEFGTAKAGEKEKEKKKPAAAKEPSSAGPIVKATTPATIVRGKLTRVTIEGENLDSIDRIELPGVPGDLAVWKVYKPDSKAVKTEIELPAGTPTGKYSVVLHGKNGKATANLLVDAADPTPEKNAGGSPTTAQRISASATIVGTLDRAGAVHFFSFRFGLKKQQQLGIHLMTREINSKIDPVLTVTDMSGRVLAESHDGYLGFTSPESGGYAIGVRDREYRGGANFRYRLNIGQIPVVTSVFPMGIQRGTRADIHLNGVFLPKSTIAFTSPADAKPGQMMPLPVGDGVLGKAQIVIGEFPEVSDGGKIPVPGAANGRILKDNQKDLWSFAAKKGQRLIVEVNARRIGSRLDSIIEILGPDDQPVPRAVLRAQAKTNVTFRDHDSAQANIRIDAWNDLAVNDLVFVGNELIKIQELPTHPDADCNFFEADGKRLGYLDTTPTHHANGTPMYKVSLHPPGSTFPPNGFPIFTLYYKNDDGGPGYGRDSRIFFDPPADGEYKVRIADARGVGGSNFGYRLTVRPPQPGFSLRSSTQKLAVPKGSAISVTITAERIDGFDGPIEVGILRLPAGLHMPRTTIDGGTFKTTVALYADANATVTGKPNRCVLEGQADSAPNAVLQFVQELDAPTLTDPGDIVTTTAESAVSIKPGGQAKLLVRIERRNGFKGRVPLDIKGLPHGVRVLDIGLNGILVNEIETARTVVLYAEPWVQTMERPFVVLARREGKGTEHAAKAVILNVK